MKTNRESRDIIVEILELCDEPKPITKIVYGCNLNVRIAKRHLTWAYIHGWIDRNEDQTEWTTTELGKSYLRLMTPVKEMEKDVVRDWND